MHSSDHPFIKGGVQLFQKLMEMGGGPKIFARKGGGGVRQNKGGGLK